MIQTMRRAPSDGTISTSGSDSSPFETLSKSAVAVASRSARASLRVISASGNFAVCASAGAPDRTDAARTDADVNQCFTAAILSPLTAGCCSESGAQIELKQPPAAGALEGMREIELADGIPEQVHTECYAGARHAVAPA